MITHWCMIVSMPFPTSCDREPQYRVWSLTLEHFSQTLPCYTLPTLTPRYIPRQLAGMSQSSGELPGMITGYDLVDSHY